ncbi:MAG TPA: hypothetical protein VM638_03630, partial [Actinomycetota bacterium]|nr:hypothetical protein [Actinomycetota bacterium]
MSDRGSVRSYAAAGITLVVLLGVVRGFDRADAEQARKMQERAALEHLVLVQSRLEQGLHRRLALAEGLRAFVGTGHLSRSSFRAFARGLLARDEGIDYVALARNGVLRHAYPPAAVSGIAGLASARSGPSDRLAPRTPALTIAGPIRLGTRTRLVARLPVSTGHGPHRQTWGIAIVAMNLDALLEDAGVRGGPFQLALRVAPEEGRRRPAFFGSDLVFRSDPQVIEVGLPGRTWELAAAPVGGWTSGSPMAWAWRGGGVLLALLGAILMWFLVDAPRRLRVAVSTATRS